MYIYPDNLKSKAVLWLWELRDIAIIGVGALISVFAMAQLGFLPPVVITAAYAHDLLDKLSEEGLINAAGRTYPALITPEGEAEARKLLAQYGIDTEERRRRSAER